MVLVHEERVQILPPEYFPIALLRALRPAHLAASCPRFHRGAPRWRDAKDAHRLEAQAKLLAALGRGDVVAAEIAHALEAVADRVAMGEHRLGGGGHVAVVL